MQTIEIGDFETAQALAEDVASKLADAIGWTVVDGTKVKKDGINIYFFTSTSGYGVFLNVSNGYTSIKSNLSFMSAGENKFNRLYITRTAGDTIAIGMSNGQNGILRFEILIARNTNGEYVGLSVSNGNSIMGVRGTYTSTMEHLKIGTIVSANISTSICKAPDVYGNCMFADLYMLTSCPYISGAFIYPIDGKNYRFLGSTSSGNAHLAIVESLGG